MLGTPRQGPELRAVDKDGGSVEFASRVLSWLVESFEVLFTIRMNESRVDVPQATKGANDNAQETKGANGYRIVRTPDARHY